MIILTLIYNSLYNSKKSPHHIQSVSMAMVYMATINTFGHISGGCMNLVSLIGPSILSKNFDDWIYYMAG